MIIIIVYICSQVTMYICSISVTRSLHTEWWVSRDVQKVSQVWCLVRILFSWQLKLDVIWYIWFVYTVKLVQKSLPKVTKVIFRGWVPPQGTKTTERWLWKNRIVAFWLNYIQGDMVKNMYIFTRGVANLPFQGTGYCKKKISPPKKTLEGKVKLLYMSYITIAIQLEVFALACLMFNNQGYLYSPQTCIIHAQSTAYIFFKLLTFCH